MKQLTIVLLCVFLSSCATMFETRPVTDYQQQQLKKEEKRYVRKGVLIVDVILCTPCVLVDFNTGRIYRPYKKEK